MDFQKSDIEAKIDSMLITHHENTPAHENDRWAKIAEDVNKSMEDHNFDGAEALSAEKAELRFKKLVQATKADIESEIDWKLLFYHEKTPLHEKDRWAKIAEGVNKSMNDKLPDSTIEFSAEAAKFRYEEVVQMMKAGSEDKTDSQPTEADTEDENHQQATETDTEDEEDSQVSEAEAEVENDRQFTISEMEDEVDWKLCATHMHQRVTLGYKDPNWTEIAKAVNELIEDENFQDVDKLTAETAEARYDALAASDNSHYHCFLHVKRM